MGCKAKDRFSRPICDIKKIITIERLCGSINKASQLNKEK
jgi:hypothetical protein